jgi:hypothetical protein
MISVLVKAPPFAPVHAQPRGSSCYYAVASNRTVQESFEQISASCVGLLVSSVAYLFLSTLSCSLLGASLVEYLYVSQEKKKNNYEQHLGRATL